VGSGCQGLDLGQVDLQAAVVGGIFVCGKRFPLTLSLLSSQEPLGLQVAGKYGCGHSGLSSHVGDGRSLRYRQAGYAMAGILGDEAHVSLCAQDLQYL